MSSEDIELLEEKVDNNNAGGGGGTGALSGGCACCSCCDTYALRLNEYIEKAFGAVGWMVGAWPYAVLGLVLLFLSLCCIGYIFVSVETDIFSLWTPTDSPVFKEKEFINYWWGQKDYSLVITSGVAKEGEDTNILTDEYLQQWYQIHIDLATQLPTKEYEYTALDNSQQTVTFGYFAEKYQDPLSLTALDELAKDDAGPTSYLSEVIPLCRPASQSPAEAQFIMPCYMVTVIDCFSEGGYFFPWENYLKNTELSSLIPGNMYTYARDSFVGLSSIEIGERLAPSCAGFSGILAPPNLIYGGETRLNESQPDSTIIALKSFQIGQYTDSPYSIARKVKIASGKCKYTRTFGISCPTIEKQDIEDAQDFLDEWLLDYIDFMKDYAEQLRNDDTKLFNLVFYTPRTTRDLLHDASSADFGLLAIAYIAMIIFASLTAINTSDWFLSRSEASFAGVLLVLFSVVATIGLGSFLQIPLSPNIVQVLPFIALGFGVDDMFILLFSFKFRERASVQEMIAETIRIAGSSVALTSLANFFGFLIGTTMVLPDVARFAVFGAIIVLLNFIAIIFGFTAVLTLVARRMKHEYNDWSFIFCWATFTHAIKITSEKPSSLDTSIFDPLFDWLTKTYTRIILLIAFFALIIAGAYGCTLISPGLPLADIVPNNSYASEFLRIREKFYHSYPLSLYTDAQEEKHKPMDWENKFAHWLNATKDVYSISPSVSRNPDVHSFWAWSLQSYLTDKHTESLTGVYEFGEAFDIETALADDPVYQVYMCVDDADMYCSTVPRLYEDTSSSLFNCLLVNYQLGNLQDDCGTWVENMYLTTVDTSVARQLYITSFEEDFDGGLYVRPSTNDIRVYIKQPNNDGYIYQVDCGEDAVVCPWRLLDAEFNILYVGDATAVEVEAPQSAVPAQGGWRDAATGKIAVAISHTYYDFFVAYGGNMRDSSQFMTGDYTPDTTFAFSSVFTPSDIDADAENACTQFEVMRLLMSESDAYTRVEFNSNITGYDTVCNAILEASEICVGIRDELDIGSVYCGTSETTANRNLWYVGNTIDDGEYEIMASPNNNGNAGVLIASEETFNNCEDPSAWVENRNFTYNYLKPCGGIDGFGGFGISDNITDSICNADDQVIELKCHAFEECTDLKACFNDYRRISRTIPGTECDGVVDRYDIKEREGKNAYSLAEIVSGCSFKYYETLSDCCQNAVNTQIIALPQYACSDFPDEAKAVCQQTDKCEYDEELFTCTEVSNGDNIFDDCNLLITGDNAQCSLVQVNITKAMVRAGEQEEFYDCLNSGDTGVTADFPGSPRVRLSGSDTCEDTFNSMQNVYADCLYPVDSFYDLTLGKYDYSMCTDAVLAAAELNYNQTCGDTNLDTDVQLQCLGDEIDLFADGCCKKAIEQIFNDEHSYSFTNECEADVEYYCTAYGVTSAGDALLAAINNVCFGDICPGVLCMTAIGTALASGTLSPKCHEAMANCEANGNWPVTQAFQTASIPCDTGYYGEQTRTCTMVSGPAQWGDVDTSACVQLTCPEILAWDDDTYDQYWPETFVDSIYKIQGGFVNSVNPANPDVFTRNQVSSTLQATYDGNDACNPLTGGTIWFARRACMLDPYNSSQAQWQTPLVECKPLAEWTNEQEQTICDFVTERVTAGLAEQVVGTAAYVSANLGYPNNWANTMAATKKANLIFAIPWTLLDDTYDADMQKDLSKAYCTLQSDNCAAFTYDSMFEISYFFDYCPTLTSADMAGNISEVYASPAYTTVEPISPPFPFDGPLSATAYLLSAQMWAKGELDPSITLTKETFRPWSFYPDPIVDEFAPQYSDLFDLSGFADRHTTFIAPLSQVEFTASWCSLRTASMYHAVAEAPADLFVPPTEAWDANGIPHPECFNNTLWLFFIDPTGKGVIKRDKVVFVDEGQVSSLTGFDNVQIKTTSNGLIVNDIDDDELAVEFIIDLRERLEEWADDELYVIPGGLVINLFSQYVNVSTYLVSNLIYVSIAIFLCGLVFLLNPIAVIVAVLCNAAMVIEVYGFADWFGLRINGVLVLNIVIAVALTMEFTAHIGRAFVLTYVLENERHSSIALPFSNDGQIRMKKTLREMFTPVSLGALTTLIGVAPIAAAQFPYFRQYYFTLYVMIVLFGWLNGVIFQVVILSFIPPKPFVHDHASSKVPKQKPRQAKPESSPDSPHQPLVQHQELQETGTKGKEVAEFPKTDDFGGEELAAKEEIIQKKHTRTNEDAP